MVKKYGIYIIIVIALLIIISLPLFIDKILMNRFITNWDIKDWAGFLGSYLGGILGSFTTLYGVWFQISRSEKQKEKDEKIDLLLSLRYCLDININNIDGEDGLFLLFDALSYNISDKIYFSKDIFYEFEKHGFENSNKIFRLEFYEEIFSLIKKTKYVNEAYKKLILNLGNKKEIMDKLINNTNNAPPFQRIKDNFEKLRIRNTCYSSQGKLVDFEERKKKVNEGLVPLKSLIKNNSFLILIYNGILNDNEKDLLATLHTYERYIIENDLFSIKEDMKKLLEKVNLSIKKLK